MTYDYAWSFFPDPAARAITHHAHWRVHYFDTWKFVENLIVDQQYVLTMRGTEPPPIFAPGYKLRLPDAEVVTIMPGLKQFTIPIERVCIEETVGLAFVEMLGLRSLITRMNEGAPPTSACALAANFLPLESENAWPVFNATLRAEQVAESCDLVVGSNDAGPVGELQHVSFASTIETDVMGRAEWLKFIALFFNRETAATAIYNGIASRFADTAAVVQTQFPGGKAEDSPAIVVAWISVYSGKFTISNSAYKINVTRDAGGVLFAPDTLSFSDVASFHAALAEGSVSAVVDESYAPDPAKYSFDDFLKGFDFVGEKSDWAFLMNAQVWRYDGLMSAGLSLDWFEGAIPNADALLADMASLISPLTPMPNKPLTAHVEVWFRNIATDQAPRIIDSGCTAAQMAAPTSAVEAAELGPSQDPAMVASCPVYLTQPWTYTSRRASHRSHHRHA